MQIQCHVQLGVFGRMKAALGCNSSEGVPPGKETAQRSSGTVLNGDPTEIDYADIENTEVIETMGETTRHFSQDTHTLMHQTSSNSFLVVFDFLITQHTKRFLVCWFAHAKLKVKSEV